MPDRSAHSTSFAKARPRVLVVDDDAAIRRLVVRVLEALGCTVTGADSVTKVRELFSTGSRFALVFVDLSLGTASGLSLIEELRAELGAEAPPFIIFSGRTPPQPMPDGVVDVIVKPAAIEHLRDAAKRALTPARRRSTDERLGAARSQRDERRSVTPTAPTAPPAAPKRATGTSATRTNPGAHVRRPSPGVVEESAPASARDRRRER